MNNPSLSDDNDNSEEMNEELNHINPSRSPSPDIIHITDDEEVEDFMDLSEKMTPDDQFNNSINSSIQQPNLQMNFKHINMSNVFECDLKPAYINLSETWIQFALTVNVHNSISCKFLYKDINLVATYFSPSFSVMFVFLNDHLRTMVKDKIFPLILSYEDKLELNNAREGPETRNCVAFSYARAKSNVCDLASKRRKERCLSRLTSLLEGKTPLKLINEQKAKHFLNRISSKCVDSPKQCSTAKTLLIYPKDGCDKISIVQDDLRCLVGNAFLNDVIIGFYCRYLYHEMLSPDDQRVNHVFDSIFLDKLMKTQKQITENPASRDDCFRSLGKWIKNIKFEDKHFLFLPANQNFHWFLVILCFPCLLFDSECNLEEYDNPRPILLILDSMSTNLYKDGGESDTSSLRSLIQEAMMTFIRCFTLQYDYDNIPVVELQVPKQNNYTDCGLFILEYFEKFLSSNPLKDFSEPFPDLSNWFDSSTIKCTRERIYNLIKKKIDDA